MSIKEKGKLLNLSPDESFKNAVREIYEKSVTATLLSYPRDIRDKGLNEIELQLENLDRAGKIRYHETHDVAVITVGEIEGSERDAKLFKFNDYAITKQKSESGLLTVHKDSTKKFEEVLTGNSVFIFGYPTSLGIKNIPQLDYDKPLLRKGIVAGKNEEMKTIILDCPVYPGNSGGPVVEVETMGITGAYFKVIGVVTQFVPFARRHKNNLQMENSGYSVAIPMDMVLDLLED